MNKNQKGEIRDIIKSQTRSIEKEIELLREKSKPISPDISLGRLTRQEARQEQEISKKILGDCEARLGRLRYAMGRIDRDEFGVCKICEEDIAYERLKILPESTICIECAKERG